MDKKYVLFRVIPNEYGEEVAGGEKELGEFTTIKAAHSAACKDADDSTLDLWQVKNYFDQGNYFWSTRINTTLSDPFYEIHSKELLG